MKLWAYIAAAALLIAALGGIYVAGYKAGQSEVEAEWLQANAEAQKTERKSRLAREAESRKAAALLVAADRRAADAAARWRAARAKRAPIATAACPAPDRPMVAGEVVDQGAYGPSDGIRFTPAGLGLWDAAWTGDEGEPVYGNPGDIAAGAVDAATPLPTLEDAVDNHAENAQRCSENRRQLSALILLIRKLQAQGN